MVFSSSVFLFIFLPIVLGLYYIIPEKHVRNAILILVSLLFYAFGEPFVVFLMIISIIINYFLGLLMQKKQLQKLILIISVIWNLGLLGIYKYAGFFVEILNHVKFFHFPVPQIALPIGISFFTFQAMSYVIDLYRKEIPVQKNFFQLLLYITFFPQLIAGPIVKYKDIISQLDKRPVDSKQIAQGIRRFIFGLSKKLLIADIVSIPVDTIFALENQELTCLLAWLGAICYTIQIYFDFSGYSDMAIGLGHMFGFSFKENFNYPYSSGNMTEFWRKWHISVSTWFKEYLYFPLGGNRKGKIRTVINKWIVFFFTGLWHGANWTFVIWGLLNGGFLMLEGMNIIPIKKMQKNLFLKIISHVYTLAVVILCFTIFRAEHVTQGLHFWRTMFGFGIADNIHQKIGMSLFLKELNPLFLVTMLVAIIFSMPVKNWIVQALQVANRKIKIFAQASSYMISLGLLLICLLYLSSGTYSPFIYLNF
ncbi:MAG: MBOAT family protein [Oscillospiraceae bacterium]|nr:MBOAT family protein [Ruminococcus sp.]MDE6707652.1 MBOAT family protein [Oscillospiraceae bacterium]